MATPRYTFSILLCGLATASIATSVRLHAAPPEEPRVFLLDGPHLHRVCQQILSGDDRHNPALESLRRDADRALAAGPFSVVDKESTPPSGDKHDYMSLAPYWWPNPDTRDGLPYIRRDGERNPEISKVPNRRDLGEMAEAVETLSLAYYFTGDEKYAVRSRLLLRTWFLEPDTRMNPRFEYAQAIRGVNTGRGIGLIESRLFTKVVDATGLIANSQAWTEADQRGLEHWFTDFLSWMRTSEHGRDEAAEQNNHGTYYDIQVASYALLLGRKELATKVLQDAREKRIAIQIEPDGRQPLELVRTKAWGYSVGNLAGLMSLARLGEHVDVDLWHYETSDGRSIRRALDFLTPFGIGGQKWPYQQIGGFSSDSIDPLLRRAATKYPDGNYLFLLSKQRKTDTASRYNLLWPLPEPADQ